MSWMSLNIKTQNLHELLGYKIMSYEMIQPLEKYTNCTLIDNMNLYLSGTIWISIGTQSAQYEFNPAQYEFVLS